MIAVSEKDLLLYWMSILSLIALIYMGIDKSSSKLRRKRISEATFWIISFLGGFPGVIIGGILFHHKTSKSSFWLPVAISVILWLSLAFSVSGIVQL
ncbi:MAG TPA: DUF1294 domain-containing protein [Nitrososphaerales archaeon]|nr:DUF1294 domain-containing protein [Nitrososphaerales archaeon]